MLLLLMVLVVEVVVVLLLLLLCWGVVPQLRGVCVCVCVFFNKYIFCTHFVKPPHV